MARTRKTRRKSTTVVVALLASAGAAYVNWPQIQKLLRASRAAEPGAAPAFASADFTIPADDQPPAAPGLEFAPLARAVSPDEPIEDPFLHRADPSTAAARSAGPPRPLPEVSLILVGQSTTRACIDGQILGPGDRVAAGTIRSIEPGAVHLALDDGDIVVLTLRTSVPPAKTQPAIPETAAMRANDKPIQEPTK